MLKVLVLIRKKSGLGRQEFIDYYENRHVPLITRLLGRFFVDYRRNFIDLDASPADPPGFDVLTEMWVQDRATLDALFTAAAEPALAAEIAADEEKFVDRSSVRIWVAEEFPRR
jgi:uncharacterized protein (TIGR02118 family)